MNQFEAVRERVLKVNEEQTAKLQRELAKIFDGMDGVVDKAAATYQAQAQNVLQDNDLKREVKPVRVDAIRAETLDKARAGYMERLQAARDAVQSAIGAVEAAAVPQLPRTESAAEFMLMQAKIGAAASREQWEVLYNENADDPVFMELFEASATKNANAGQHALDEFVREKRQRLGDTVRGTHIKKISEKLAAIGNGGNSYFYGLGEVFADDGLHLRDSKSWVALEGNINYQMQQGA